MTFEGLVQYLLQQKPSMIVLESVVCLLRNKRNITMVMETLRNVGYIVVHVVLNMEIRDGVVTMS